jgi:hypothetical protein
MAFKYCIAGPGGDVDGMVLFTYNVREASGGVAFDRTRSVALGHECVKENSYGFHVYLILTKVDPTFSRSTTSSDPMSHHLFDQSTCFLFSPLLSLDSCLGDHRRLGVSPPSPSVQVELAKTKR